MQKLGSVTARDFRGLSILADDILDRTTSAAWLVEAQQKGLQAYPKYQDQFNLRNCREEKHSIAEIWGMKILFLALSTKPYDKDHFICNAKKLCK